MEGKELAVDLAALRQRLPDPFAISARREEVHRDKVTQNLLAKGQVAAERLLDFFSDDPEPALANVAALVLSFFPPADFYDRLLAVLAGADRGLTAAFEPGLWWIDLPEERLARDLVEVVRSSGNPNPLLLLQRPVASRVRPELAAFVAKRSMPLSLYALFAQTAALDRSDVPLLRQVSKWTDLPQMSSLAGLSLLEMGLKDGLEGVLAGLLATDENIRSTTYYQAARHLSQEVIEQTKYNPSGAPDSLREQAGAIIRALAADEPKK